MKHFGFYDAAFDTYGSIFANSTNLSQTEVRYIILQKAFCKLYGSDTIGLSHEIHLLKNKYAVSDFGVIEQAYYHFVIGKFNMMSNDIEIGQIELLRSKSAFGEIVNENFLKFAVFKELAYYHRRFSAEIDSTHLYFLSAQKIANEHLSLSYATYDFYLDRADLYLINRDYQSGLNYVDFIISEMILQTAMDSSFWARAMLVKGKMLQYIGRDAEGDSITLKVSEVLSKIETKPRVKADLYVQLILDATSKNDSVSFFNLIGRLSEMKHQVPIGFYNINRLKGYYYYNQPNFGLAAQHYVKMLEEFKSQEEFDIVQLMEGYYVLSDSYLNLGDYGLSEKYAYESLVYETIYKDKPFEWKYVISKEVAGELYNFINYAKLSEIYLRHFLEGNGGVNQLERALKLYMIIDSVMINQVKVIEEDAVLNFLNIGHGIYSNAIRTAYHLYDQIGNEKHLEMVHYFIEQSKELLVFRDILANDDNLFPEVPSSFRERELYLKSKISALKRELLIRDDNDKKSELKSYLKKQNNHYQIMADLYPNYFSEKYDRKIPSTKEVLLMADSLDATIVSFHSSGSDIFEIVYGSDQVFIHHLNFDSSLSKSMAEFKKTVSNPKSLVDSGTFNNFQRFGFELYEKIIAPIINEPKRLIVIPDGPLKDLPFEALVTEISDSREIDYRSLNYMIKTRQISYERSLKAIDRNINKKFDFKNARVLAYGFSDEKVKFSNSRNNTSTLSELKYSFNEMNSIKTTFGEFGNRFRYGMNATKEEFISDIQEDYQIIHLAMHASSSTTDKLDNKIYFRNKSTEIEQDTILFGYEIFPMDFTNDLIVLSSCESTIGPNLVGEGTYNLARAFTQGGAAKIVASMWKINDFQTSQIIHSFYSRLKETGNPSLALHKAKVTYILESDEYGASPFYWSGLVCYGF